MTTAKKSSKGTGRTPHGSKTSSVQTQVTLQKSTSSPAAFRAKISHSATTAAPASKESEAVFGSATLESFASYDLASSSWRTCLPFDDADSDASSVIWPRAGTMLSGTVYQLLPSAPIMSGTGSSWSRGLHPTPSASPYGSGQNGINGKGGEFERPSAGTPSLWSMARSMDGVLDPLWLEWTMGLPPGWTVLDGESSVTQSSHRLASTSHVSSSPPTLEEIEHWLSS
ncbi:conserved hypothetical protein [Virus Rctr197k]|nr:conserved hypothetical protein [Virus Rctr197k]